MPSASIQKLIQIPIFRSLSEDEVGQIVKLSEERSVSRSDKVFDEGGGVKAERFTSKSFLAVQRYWQSTERRP